MFFADRWKRMIIFKGDTERGIQENGYFASFAPQWFESLVINHYPDKFM